MKYVVFGDVHGEYYKLLNLLRIIEQKYVIDDYTLVFLGDLIDRGPLSFSVVDYVKRKVEDKKAIAVIGNHELMMLEAYHYWKKQGEPYPLWLYNGGKQALKSYCDMFEYDVSMQFFAEAFEKSGHYNFLKNLPLYYETDEVWFSHAPIPKDEYLPRHTFLPKELYTWSTHHQWNRDYPWRQITEEQYVKDHGKLAVCGHVHALLEDVWEARVYKEAIHIDSGCGCHPDAPLSVAIIENGKLVEILESD